MMRIARAVATFSRDRTPIGCVIVRGDVIVSTGYNGQVRGLNLDGDKYMVTEHAERNAIYNAARVGVSVAGGVAYVTGPPCCDCARAIVQSGLKGVVWEGCLHERWAESVAVGERIIKESGLTYEKA